MQVDYY